MHLFSGLGPVLVDESEGGKKFRAVGARDKARYSRVVSR